MLAQTKLKFATVLDFDDAHVCHNILSTGAQYIGAPNSPD